MNKKGMGFFSIFPGGWIGLFAYVIFGIGLWFIYSSFKDYFEEIYFLTPIQSLVIGIIIVLVILGILKYKPYRFLMR